MSLKPRNLSNCGGFLIIVKLKGGLGNQLFQYSLGRRLAIENQTVLKFDVVSGFRNDPYHRRYCLEKFNIVENLASSAELQRAWRLQARTLSGWCQRLGGRFLPNGKFRLVREPSFTFNERLLRLSGNLYLEGYWQSEKYFKSIEAELREEITIKHPILGLNLHLAEKIGASNSVSIHIRRIHDQKAIDILGVLPPSYYQHAINLMHGEVDRAHFYVFSDDPEWSRSHLPTDLPMTIVSNNGEGNEHEDLRLMSMCRHHIIANSTFSWWGAWLGRNETKIVIAPQNWFASNLHDTRDLIPIAWRRIS